MSREIIKVEDLEKEAKESTDLLKGKIVKRIYRHKHDEIAIIFECGARLFVDSNTDLELSITGV
mgnify:CR=1 FL=1